MNHRFSNSKRGNGSSVSQCSTTSQYCFIFSSATFGILVVMKTVGFDLVEEGASGVTL
jgi:hypothetical protein